MIIWTYRFISIELNLGSIDELCFDAFFALKMFCHVIDFQISKCWMRHQHHTMIALYVRFFDLQMCQFTKFFSKFCLLIFEFIVSCKIFVMFSFRCDVFIKRNRKLSSKKHIMNKHIVQHIFDIYLFDNHHLTKYYSIKYVHIVFINSDNSLTTISMFDVFDVNELSSSFEIAKFSFTFWNICATQQFFALNFCIYLYHIKLSR